MKRAFITTALLSAVCLMSTTATAAPIVVGDTGSWQTVASGPGTFSTSNSPYWNGPSWDSIGGPCNVGSLVSGTTCNGSFNLGATANGDASYWGTAGGGADTDFYLDAGASATYELTMHAALTAWNDNNELGWYNPLTGEHQALFSADMAMGDSVTVTLPDVFGFYYRNTDYEQTYYTQSSLNNGGTLGNGSYGPEQQFALFNEGNYWWLGLEDLFGPLMNLGDCSLGHCSDWDYQDMIVGFQVVNVPEPGMTALLGLGLLSLAWVARRRIVTL